MTKVIRDTGTLVLIKRDTVSRTDHHNPLIFKLLTQSQNMVSQTFTKKDNLGFFLHFKNLLQSTVHKYKSPDFSTFPVAVKKMEYFLKVKVKCYSKKRMIPIEKYIYFT